MVYHGVDPSSKGGTLHDKLTSCAISKVIARKPCYRKDDRAMRPIYECPENCM